MHWNKLVPELVVHDYARSREFYTNVFGFTLRFERLEDQFGYFDLDDAQVMLLGRAAAIYQMDRPGPIGKGLHFQVEVASLDAMLQRLAMHAVEPTTPVTMAWYRADDIEHGQKEFFVADPDGYLFRFSEYVGERPALIPSRG